MKYVNFIKEYLLFIVRCSLFKIGTFNEILEISGVKHDKEQGILIPKTDKIFLYIAYLLLHKQGFE